MGSPLHPKLAPCMCKLPARAAAATIYINATWQSCQPLSQPYNMLTHLHDFCQLALRLLHCPRCIRRLLHPHLPQGLQLSQPLLHHLDLALHLLHALQPASRAASGGCSRAGHRRISPVPRHNPCLRTQQETCIFFPRMAPIIKGAKQCSASHPAYLLVQLQCGLDAGNGSLLPLGRLLCLLRLPGLPVHLLLDLAHLALCRKHLGAHLQQGVEKQDALGSGSLRK